jgi:hypothetical protein
MYSWTHQKFHKYEVARNFDDESFGGSKNPSFLKLHAVCSGLGRIHTRIAEGQGMYIHLLNKHMSHIFEKAKKNLSRC